MSKWFKTKEINGEKIDEVLAQNITDLFRNGMNEEQFLEITKDENNPRPINCEGLTKVTTNQLIWDILSTLTQTNERKMQIVQIEIVKASTLLVKVVDIMALSNHDYHIEQVGDILFWDIISELGNYVPIGLYLYISIGTSRVFFPAHTRRFKQRKMESKPYYKSVIHRNPGKKEKGMDTSTQVHHTGPRNQHDYITDSKLRASCLAKRKPTLFQSAETLYKKTHAGVYLEVKPQHQNPVHYKSPYYEDHIIVKNEVDINNNTSTSGESSILDSSTTSQNSPQGSSNIENETTKYPSPTKRRTALKALYSQASTSKGKQGKGKEGMVNKCIQTMSIKDVEEGEKGPNVCRVCGVRHESEEDVITDSQWIGCDFKVVKKGEESDCGYWVHEKCVGLYPMERKEKKGKRKGRGRKRKANEDDEDDVNRKWFCPEHRF